jgi:hypothetical protein
MFDTKKGGLRKSKLIDLYQAGIFLKSTVFYVMLRESVTVPDEDSSAALISEHGAEKK